MKDIRRCGLYMADLNPAEGSEQGGIRPVLVVSNNAGNASGTISVIVPITSQVKKHIPAHVELTNIPGLPKKSTALCEQIRTLDHSRMISYLGYLEPAIMDEINRAVSRNLDLDRHQMDLLYLCPVCRDRFFKSAAYAIRRIDKFDPHKEICSFCSMQKGYGYHVYKLPIGQKKEVKEYDI